MDVKAVLRIAYSNQKWMKNVPDLEQLRQFVFFAGLPFAWQVFWDLPRPEVSSEAPSADEARQQDPAIDIFFRFQIFLLFKSPLPKLHDRQTTKTQKHDNFNAF